MADVSLAARPGDVGLSARVEQLSWTLIGRAAVDRDSKLETGFLATV